MLMTPETEDFFRGRLDQMIDLRKPLPRLSSRMPWQEIEASIAQLFVRKVRAGKEIEHLGLFGNASTLEGGGLSKAGRPRLPLRLMVSLLYLKHAFNESDEGVVRAGARRRPGSIFQAWRISSHGYRVMRRRWSSSARHWARMALRNCWH